MCFDIYFYTNFESGHFQFIYYFFVESSSPLIWKMYFNCEILNFTLEIQARIAQLVAYRLGSGEVPVSNPGKGENFSVKKSNWIIWIWIQIFLRLTLLLNFRFNVLKTGKKIFQWYLNRYYLMIFIQCYYQCSKNVVVKKFCWIQI